MQYLNSSNYVSFCPWRRCQIDIKCVFYRLELGGTQGNGILKIFKRINEIHQRIEPKKWMKKMWSFVKLSCLLPELCSSKRHVLHFLLITANNQSNYGQNPYVHLEDLIEFFQIMVSLIDFELTVREKLRIEI